MSRSTIKKSLILMAINYLWKKKFNENNFAFKSVFGIAVAVVAVVWKKLFYKKYF